MAAACGERFVRDWWSDRCCARLDRGCSLGAPKDEQRDHCADRCPRGEEQDATVESVGQSKRFPCRAVGDRRSDVIDAGYDDRRDDRRSQHGADLAGGLDYPTSETGDGLLDSNERRYLRSQL
jgi:hypothetical protein